MLNAVEGGAKGFLIDGYPRDVEQGKRFEEKVFLPFYFFNW